MEGFCRRSAEKSAALLLGEKFWKMDQKIFIRKNE